MLTSTTAPGKTFSSRSELADHYKSDWHKYNLKRREAGLPLLEEGDFMARWEAALALRKEQKEGKSGTGHLKQKQRPPSKKKKQPFAQVSSSSSSNNNNANKERKGDDDNTDDDDDDKDAKTPKGDESSSSAPATTGKRLPQKLVESQENPTIDPFLSLFDNNRSMTLEENVEYMRLKYGFFIPDREYLRDLEGLLGYCHEKVKLGHYCLYCNQVFPTWQGCQNHMISKQHAKLRYERGHWDELDPFYDFKKENAEFISSSTAEHDDDGGKKQDDAPVVGTTSDDGDNDDDWEDVSDDEDNNDDDDDVYDGYEREIARFGLDVTALGELVFPDGRIVGHRALKRYYKQNHRPMRNSTEVVAARVAAGERIHEGQVINIAGARTMPTDKLKGVGKGILVGLKDGVEGFSALSLYRYRAAVVKQRRNDDKGKRIQYRTTMNMNRMDKKGNRLMNGVSVAHALR